MRRGEARDVQGRGRGATSHDPMERDRFLAQLTTADPATAQIANLRASLAEILALCLER